MEIRTETKLGRYIQRGGDSGDSHGGVVLIQPMQCEYLHQTTTSLAHCPMELDSEMGSPVGTLGPRTCVNDSTSEENVSFRIQSYPDLRSIRRSKHGVAETSTAERDVTRLGVYDNIFPLTLTGDN